MLTGQHGRSHRGVAVGVEKAYFFFIIIYVLLPDIASYFRSAYGQKSHKSKQGPQETVTALRKASE